MILRAFSSTCFRLWEIFLSKNLLSWRVYDSVLPVRRKIHVPLAIMHIKTDSDLTRWRSELLKVGITGIDILAHRETRLTDDIPGAWIDPRPVGCEVHIIDCGITRMGRIGIGSKVHDAADG